MRRKRLCAWVLSALLVGLVPASAFAAWQDENILVAHCLGEADGKIETNSKEAFISSWENGFRVFEADFVYTTDGTLVVRHDFEEDGSYYRLEQNVSGDLRMSSTKYAQSKIVYEQTPLTAADLLLLMHAYPDAYLVTDTKSTDKEAVQRQFRDLNQIAKNLGITDVLARIIPQIYHEEMLVWVKEIHDFPEWIFTLYQNENDDYSAIAAFCVQNKVSTVTIPREVVTSDIVNIFHAQGIKVYAHTVNRYLMLEELLNMGVDGVYTDRIKPYELPWVGKLNPRSLKLTVDTIGGESITFNAMQIFGDMYVPLRDFATLGNGFSAIYQAETKTISLTSGKAFTQLGNEILMDERGRLITKKSDIRIQYNGKDTDLKVFLVDGEIYVSLEKIKALLGFSK